MTDSRESFTTEMRKNDDHWRWKTGLRSFLLVVDIIGIGSVASIVAKVEGPRTYGDYASHVVAGYVWYPWGLITLSVSATWSFVALLVHFIRRRPAHPGIAVGIDLVLWLGFIATACFIGIGAWETTRIGAHGIVYDYESRYYSTSGHYELASNGTWVYKMPVSYFAPQEPSPLTFLNYTTGRYEFIDPKMTAVRQCGPKYVSCAEKDAVFNRAMAEHEEASRVVILGTVCEGLALVLHFVLFVWACVDTHRRKRLRASNQAQQIAEKIIHDMTQRGQITLHQPIAQPLLKLGHNQSDPRVISPTSTQGQPMMASLHDQTTGPYASQVGHHAPQASVHGHDTLVPHATTSVPQAPGSSGPTALLSQPPSHSSTVPPKTVARIGQDDTISPVEPRTHAL